MKKLPSKIRETESFYRFIVTLCKLGVANQNTYKVARDEFDNSVERFVNWMYGDLID